MWAAFWDALQEVGGRRVVIVLLVLAFLVGLLFNHAVTFGVTAGVQVLFEGAVNMGPWPIAVPVILGRITAVAGTIWLILMIFAGCPQFVAMLEKGWRELTFSKGTPRWQILLSRCLSLILLFYALVLVSCLPVAVRLWLFTGISPLNVLGGVMISTFSFAALLSAGALISLLGQGGVALPILAPISFLILSQLLLTRETVLYDYVTSEFIRRMLDWVYYVLPKCPELQNAAAAFVTASTLPSSWPLWTTGLFTAATMSLTVRLLERKSF